MKLLVHEIQFILRTTEREMSRYHVYLKYAVSFAMTVLYNVQDQRIMCKMN